MWCKEVGEKKRIRNVNFRNLDFYRVVYFNIILKDLIELNVPPLWKSFLTQLYFSNLRPICYYVEVKSYSKMSYNFKISSIPDAIKSFIYVYNLILLIYDNKKIETLDFIEFHDIRPEFFQYSLLLNIVERDVLIKVASLEEKLTISPLEEEEIEKNKEKEGIDV